MNRSHLLKTLETGTHRVGCGIPLLESIEFFWYIEYSCLSCAEGLIMWQQLWRSSRRWILGLGPGFGPLCSAGCRGLLHIRAVEGREDPLPFSFTSGGGLPGLGGLRRVGGQVDEVPSQPVPRIHTWSSKPSTMEKVRNSRRCNTMPRTSNIRNFKQGQGKIGEKRRKPTLLARAAPRALDQGSLWR